MMLVQSAQRLCATLRAMDWADLTSVRIIASISQMVILEAHPGACVHSGIDPLPRSIPAPWVSKPTDPAAR